MFDDQSLFFARIVLHFHIESITWVALGYVKSVKDMLKV